METILDVRGIGGRAARIREIREMAGRAMLDGPHDYKTQDLDGPLLDLAVSKAIGLSAVIHRVDNAIAPFWECCILNQRGRLIYQYLPSRNWSQGGDLIEEHHINLTYLGNSRWAAEIKGERFEADAPLLAAMRALVSRLIGDTVRM